MEKIHIDFLQHEGATMLILCDHFSKWVEACLVLLKNCVNALPLLEHHPLVFDNGPPFNSEEFNTFCWASGISGMKSPLYHPKSNRLTERAVQILKQNLKKKKM
ncbi:hypothetical protein PR048_010925 [Dryococelus australis]|uniref:Integrase catalytic domain-containing protein n=1 Tax=Dryococelus australis TaxID=614101 RepID=A0ABQ9HK83_9NEOP|nr:hypothetical protein PR048_010925 [Dryococelus australis]